jgi:hypothetical protein
MTRACGGDCFDDQRHHPSIGLRPGAEYPGLEPLIPIHSKTPCRPRAAAYMLPTPQM